MICAWKKLFIRAVLVKQCVAGLICRDLLIAPRPVLFMTGDADKGSPIDGIRIIETNVAEVYDLYGATNHFQSVVYPGLGHKCLPEMWENTLEWFNKDLKNDSDK